MKTQPLNSSMNEKCGENRKIYPKIEHTLQFCMLLVTLIAFKATMKKDLKEPMEIFKEIIQELKKRKFN